MDVASCFHPAVAAWFNQSFTAPTAAQAQAWPAIQAGRHVLIAAEPVFGIIKSVMGFRQFLLRGLDQVRGEWSLVTIAWNIKRMFALSLG